MKTYFTSDLHLGHGNIVRQCARPFADTEEMDRTLVSNWNAVVGAEDEVYVLGDFSYRSGKAPKSYLSQLRGTKHLRQPRWRRDSHRTVGTVRDYAEVSIGGTRLVLLH